MHRRITGRLVIATHNPGKLKEMRELLEPFQVEAVVAGTLGLPEPPETGTSFRDNARIKAAAAATASGLAAFADDSGLAVDALDGAPGILSARWAGESQDFRLAMEKVEGMLRERDAFDPPARRAHFVSPCAWHGPTAIGKSSRRRSTARWCGRHAATKVSATTRCSCRRAKR